MEGLNPNKIEVTSQGSWEGLKEQSKAEARELIDSIVGYENMSSVEKRAAIHALLHELVEDNKNRFVAEAISVQLSKLNEEERHAARMSELDASS